METFNINHEEANLKQHITFQYSPEITYSPLIKNKISNIRIKRITEKLRAEVVYDSFFW